jgi:hypothetical protein
MTRFSDEWVVDRTMFDFIQGGSSCACCGLPHLFNPGGIKGFIEACTDIEADAAASELDALEKSPWPPQMREEVWGDRVKLRLLMKRGMKKYKKFFKDHSVAQIREWCLSERNTDELRRMFHMPRSEIKHIIETTYGIYSSYSVVLCAVTEQVANFQLTNYETDAVTEEEADFEDMLYFNPADGFMLVMQEDIKVDVVEAFLQYMIKLGGPKLLFTRASSHPDPSNDSNSKIPTEDGDGDAAETYSEGPSFRSDRRIVRLLIGRYFADRIIDQYTESLKKNPSSEANAQD